jgi:hypothetical protein
VSRSASSRSVWARIASVAASASAAEVRCRSSAASGDADVLGGGLDVPPAQHPGAEGAVGRHHGALVVGVEAGGVDRDRGEDALDGDRVDDGVRRHRHGEQGGQRCGGGGPAGDDQVAALQPQRRAMGGDLGAEQARGFERRFQAGPDGLVEVVGEVDELGEAGAGALGLPGQRRRVRELTPRQFGDASRGLVDRGLLVPAAGLQRGALAAMVVDRRIGGRAECGSDAIARVGEC